MRVDEPPASGTKGEEESTGGGVWDFDLHMLNYDEIDEVNKWLKATKFGQKKKKQI